MYVHSFFVFSMQQKPYSNGKKTTNTATIRTHAKTHCIYRLGKGNWEKITTTANQPKAIYHGERSGVVIIRYLPNRWLGEGQ